MSRLVLASASKARAALLRNAGLDIEIRPAQVDEGAIKTKILAAGASPSDIALALAREKSRAISVGVDGFVIGADQVLVHDRHLFDKPQTMAEAAGHLKTLRGSTHQLISAVSVSSDGLEMWSTIAVANLTMRPFSDAFLDAYLERFGEEVLTSVGAYHLEGLGAQLFSRIDGDYFTILGLPLLELLAFLRSQDILTK